MLLKTLLWDLGAEVGPVVQSLEMLDADTILTH